MAAPDNVTMTNGHISNHTATTWDNGDLITADKLNNLENATKNGLDTLVLDIVIDPAESDKKLSERSLNITNATAQDLINTFNNGTNIIFLIKDSVSGGYTKVQRYTLYDYNFFDQRSSFQFISGNSSLEFSANSFDDYPFHVDIK